MSFVAQVSHNYLVHVPNWEECDLHIDHLVFNLRHFFFLYESVERENHWTFSREEKTWVTWLFLQLTMDNLRAHIFTLVFQVNFELYLKFPTEIRWNSDSNLVAVFVLSTLKFNMAIQIMAHLEQINMLWKTMSSFWTKYACANWDKCNRFIFIAIDLNAFSDCILCRF